MSRVAPKTGEAVPRDKRRAMTPVRRERIWGAARGRCGLCGLPVAAHGPTVRYDHIIPIWLKGSDADEDIWPLHTDGCDSVKTPADLRQIAKTKRQAAMLEPTQPPKRPIRSRGFAPGKRKMASRPMRKKP